MGKFKAVIRAALVISAGLWLASCSSLDRRHGYVPTEEDLAQIQVGVDNKDTVAELVGRPTTAGILSDGGWFYVESKFRTYGYRDKQEIDREVVAISFTDSGVVENVERFGLEDGKVFAISRRVTDSNIRGISFLRQLFGSLGNFAFH